jgi:hypothetical protein
MSATFLPRISFVIIVGKKDIMNIAKSTNIFRYP